MLTDAASSLSRPNHHLESRSRDSRRSDFYKDYQHTKFMRNMLPRFKSLSSAMVRNTEQASHEHLRRRRAEPVVSFDHRQYSTERRTAQFHRRSFLSEDPSTAYGESEPSVHVYDLAANRRQRVGSALSTAEAELVAALRAAQAARARRTQGNVRWREAGPVLPPGGGSAPSQTSWPRLRLARATALTDPGDVDRAGGEGAGAGAAAGGNATNYWDSPAGLADHCPLCMPDGYTGLPKVDPDSTYNYLPMTQEMARHIKCDSGPDCLQVVRVLRSTPGPRSRRRALSLFSVGVPRPAAPAPPGGLGILAERVYRRGGGGDGGGGGGGGGGGDPQDGLFARFVPKEEQPLGARRCVPSLPCLAFVLPDPRERSARRGHPSMLSCAWSRAIGGGGGLGSRNTGLG